MEPSVTVSYGKRHNRICDVCGGFDDHPRHVISLAEVTSPPPVTPELVKKLALTVDLSSDGGVAALADLYDQSLMLRHPDCCRSVGCPDGSCHSLPEKTGYDLLAHIVGA